MENCTSNENFAWNHKTTLIFLNEFRKRHEEFKNPTQKKKDVWEKIANDMRLKGYAVAGYMLDKKLRNMKSTYRIILENSNKSSGKCRVKWKYFDIFQDIFQNTTNETSVSAKFVPKFESDSSSHDEIDSYLNIESYIPTLSSFTWNYENTILFLEKFKARYYQFQDPNRKKKDVWEELAEEMRQEGYDISADMLDRKMRNMKSTYRTILDDNNKKPGQIQIKWDFFDIFHDIFQNGNFDESESLKLISSIESIQSSTGIPSSFNWNYKNTLIFLEEFKNKYEYFKDPKNKKKDLWESIACEMRQKGYDVTANMLDRKLRNMKITFRTILNNNYKKSTVKGRVKWKYFRVFQEIFQNDRKRIFEKRYEETHKLLKLEEMKLEELRKLREAIEESNKLSLERICLLRENLKRNW